MAAMLATAMALALRAATAAFEKVVMHSPDGPVRHQAAALLQQLRGHWPHALLLHGQAGIGKLRFAQHLAQGLLCEAQQRHPDDLWLNCLLGQYWEKENPQVAVGYFRAAVAIRPKSDELWSRLGIALSDSGDAEGAVAAFRQAVTLNPNSAAAREFTTALTQSGRLEEARAAWAKRLELDPPEHEAWFGYADRPRSLASKSSSRGKLWKERRLHGRRRRTV